MWSPTFGAIFIFACLLDAHHIFQHEPFFMAKRIHTTNDGGSGIISNATRIRRFSASKAREETRFWLYTRRNPTEGQELKIDSPATIAKSNLNKYWPVRFIIHGFLSGKSSKINSVIRAAYLQKGNFNVIVVDWGAISGSLFRYLLFENVYSDVASSIGHVGRIVADFSKFLNADFDISFGSMYLIGHSLGAHIAGYAGSFVFPNRFNTIFALDPAGPLFEGTRLDKVVDRSDAFYVESIHTDVTMRKFIAFGQVRSGGHVAFYPNYGTAQPGCYMPTCSHSRAYHYFAESIISPRGFWARQCDSTDDILNRDCPSIRPRALMGGEPSQSNRTGIFYLRTNHEPPFARSYQVNIIDYAYLHLFTPLRKDGLSALMRNSTNYWRWLDPHAPVRIIITNSNSDSDHSEDSLAVCMRIKDAYLRIGRFNVIIVDWQKVLHSRLYRTEVFDDDIAKLIARISMELNNRLGIAHDSMYLIGEGSAARIAVYSGLLIQPFKFQTIFGLNVKNKIPSGGSYYLEIIQTTTNYQHKNASNFYIVNENGKHCPKDNHRCVFTKPAYQYFIDTILKRDIYWGRSCNRTDHMENAYCEPIRSPKEISRFMGGEPGHHNPNGVYFVQKKPTIFN